MLKKTLSIAVLTAFVLSISAIVPTKSEASFIDTITEKLSEDVKSIKSDVDEDSFAGKILDKITVKKSASQPSTLTPSKSNTTIIKRVRTHTIYQNQNAYQPSNSVPWFSDNAGKTSEVKDVISQSSPKPIKKVEKTTKVIKNSALQATQSANLDNLVALLQEKTTIESKLSNKSYYGLDKRFAQNRLTVVNNELAKANSTDLAEAKKIAAQ